MTTLTEKLRQIADWKPGNPAPPCVDGIGIWGYQLAAIAQEAADEIDNRSKWLKPKQRISDAALRAIWLKAGGNFHGPNIEHGIMPERKLLPFLRMLIEGGVP